MQQQTRNRALTTHVWTDGIEDIQSIIDTVVGAHMETCEFTRNRVCEMKLRAKDCPNYTEPTRVSDLATKKKKKYYDLILYYAGRPPESMTHTTTGSEKEKQNKRTV